MTKEGYQRNKYLDDLGIPINKYGTNWLDKTDSRWEEWEKERELYGFDARECWNLDSIFVEWIYSHFMKYKEDCNVDLTQYKFEYKSSDKDKIKMVTQEQAINIICDACKEWLLTDFNNRIFLSEEIMQLIGDVMPAMWW